MSGINEQNTLNDSDGLRIWCLRDSKVLSQYLVDERIPIKTVIVFPDIFYERLRITQTERINRENLRKVARTKRIMVAKTPTDLERYIAYFDEEHIWW